MNLEIIDWIILSAFFAVISFIIYSTQKKTKSVAGFLSSERCAGRYILTMANAMAFCSAIGIVASFESLYRAGITSMWWSLIGLPVGLLVAMSGWVIYRYRETRCLTMAQFLEVRYSKNLRICAGFLAFLSGFLNCAVFPMVTANFIMYFMGLPSSFQLLGITMSTFHCVMFVIVSIAVILATSGGQITIMVTDFFTGFLANVVAVTVIFYILFYIGWPVIMETLANAENLDYNVVSDMVDVKRVNGVSLVNPFKIDGLPDFGVPYFIMLTISTIFKTGVWQGNAGYQAAARTPHEAKMGTLLGEWRYLIIMLFSTSLGILAYVVLKNDNFTAIQGEVANALTQIDDGRLQAQMLAPIALAKTLPAGILGMVLIFMIGAAVSTDDSYYHSWGSTFLQDVIMPFRKKPFPKDKHMLYLRISIACIGLGAFLFSSFFELKDFIYMWFQITMAIYMGGASCAIIGGLYWKKGSTPGAWTGLILGSTISLFFIWFKQTYPDFEVGNVQLNGMHYAMITLAITFTCYIIVSLLTSKEDFNLERLLHRGEYAAALPEEEALKKQKKPSAAKNWLAEKLTFSDEFSKGDKLIYRLVTAWITVWVSVFIVGTAYNLTYKWVPAGGKIDQLGQKFGLALTERVSTESWINWWQYHLGAILVLALICTVWFSIGGLRDTIALYRTIGTNVDESDDGTVHQHHNATDDLLVTANIDSQNKPNDVK